MTVSPSQLDRICTLWTLKALEIQLDGLSILLRRDNILLPQVWAVVPGARGSAVGWGAALQAGRWRVRFPVVIDIEIFHWRNPSGRAVALGSTQTLTVMSTRDISWGVGVKAANLTTMCRLFWIPGASTSWISEGLSRNCFTCKSPCDVVEQLWV